MKYQSLREEELKNKIAADFFSQFDNTEIIKNIDFAVKAKTYGQCTMFGEYLLWAEAKNKKDDIPTMLAQLILTIGKARTFDEYMPPPYLGCFDNEKIAFVPYSDIQEIFYVNDFNWNVAPSNRETREFALVLKQINKSIGHDKKYIFSFDKDEKELKQFINDNFIVGKTGTSKLKIDKNNFLIVYNKWLDSVKPTINIAWDDAKENGLIDADFYLADLLSRENETLKEKLSVLLKTNYYQADRHINKIGLLTFSTADFKDNQKAHTSFWTKYERPPLEEYWDYIIERRDLLVPQDIRERKGSFFTPRQWVELSQKYIADVLGKDWQDEYYVWDCAAGTGNLLAGLTNKYNIWASTLDKADVDVMKDRIHNGANLLEDHVFQFDFLNDDFSKLPQGLQGIINDPKRRKKLIVYINPPYAEATTTKTMRGTSDNKPGVANLHKTKEQYKNVLGKASNEVFAQFLIKIYYEIPSCMIANFSKLKNLQSDNFQEFRKNFIPKLEKTFLMPANTFDNVSGNFPIGFFIWSTAKKETFKQINADVFDKNGMKIGKKTLRANTNTASINKWIKLFTDDRDYSIGYLPNPAPDFQNNNYLFITTEIGTRHVFYIPITKENIIPVSIYFAVRKVISATWLNDRDQYLFPNNKWETDVEFQNDCFAFTLFHGSNNISSKDGVNHWIPFTENEINARDKFGSHFMVSFIGGKIIQNGYSNLFEQEEDKFCIKRKFSLEAKNVFDAGRKLWRYYHAQPNANVNASLYDIRDHFQGRDDKGKMNPKSDDETYTELLAGLRAALKSLAQKIEPCVYEYGFLRR